MELPSAAAVRHAIPIALAMGLLVGICTLLASTYVGHGSSPYDTCATPGGRLVSCELLAKVR